MASSRVFQGCRALLAAAKGASAAQSTATKGASAAQSTATKVSKGTGGGGGRALTKALPISTLLGGFLGASEASRVDAVKKIWEYIKLHNLQNPQNKKEILCDEKLKMIFNGKDSVGMLEVPKLLSQHFLKSS